jgi:outer membrane protein assembly factor BamB
VVIIPNAPADLVALGSGPREIALTWKDQADNEAGFSLERRFSLDPEFSEIARLDPDSASFTDTAVLPETTYCYRVRSFTASGQSDYSNESCAAGTTELVLYEFSTEVQAGVFSRVAIPDEIRSALPVGARFVEEPHVTVGERTSRALSDVNLQLSPSTGSIFGTPIGSGEFPFLLAVFSNGHKLARIWGVLTIKPAANLARRTTQTGSPPQVLFIDFPAQIRATGTPITGFVGFSDPDGDLVKAEFTVVSATEFQNFQITPDVTGRTESAFAFEIATKVSQRVTLSVTLTDEAGQASQPVEFSFESLPVSVLRVSPDRLEQQGMAGLGELPPLKIEISNGGSGMLKWTALTDAPWLTISPEAGETVAGEKSLLTVTAGNAHLGAGLHRALVMIRAPGAQNSPQWVRFLLELTPAGGSLRWQTRIGPTDFSPALGTDGTIYIAGDDQSLYALSPDGQIRWTFRASQPIFSASAAIAPNGTIYFGAEDGNLYALNPDGKEKWRFTADLPLRSSPAVGPDGIVYIGSLDHSLYAIKPDGQEKWRFRTEGPVHSSPAIAADGVVYIGSDDGHLYAVNPDGTKRWSFKTDGEIRSSPVILADGTVYIASRDGVLYAIRGEAGPADSPWPMFRHNAQRTGLGAKP